MRGSWEPVERSDRAEVERFPVPGGWLYRVQAPPLELGVDVAFVPHAGSESLGALAQRLEGLREQLTRWQRDTDGRTEGLLARLERLEERLSGGTGLVDARPEQSAPTWLRRIYERLEELEGGAGPKPGPSLVGLEVDRAGTVWTAPELEQRLDELERQLRGVLGDVVGTMRRVTALEGRGAPEGLVDARQRLSRLEGRLHALGAFERMLSAQGELDGLKLRLDRLADRLARVEAPGRPRRKARARRARRRRA